MYDIEINELGIPKFNNYDIYKSTYERYLSQKIYGALMSIPPSLITGLDKRYPDIIETSISAYMFNYFIGDSDIDPANVVIKINDVVEDNVKISIGYRTTSPTGDLIGIDYGIDFNYVAGALVSADFDPSYLLAKEFPEKEDIKIYLTVDNPTNEIELPIEPYSDIGYSPLNIGDNILAAITFQPILLCDKEDYVDTSAISKDFSINITNDQLLYQIERYINNFISSDYIIDNIIINSVPDGFEYILKQEYGSHILISSNNVIGTVTGQVSAIKAKYISYSFYIKDKIANKYVFKLKPIRGKIIALFSKTVSPGVYVLKYKGVKNTI